MPLPWRKTNKITRISQIVADLHSPKHGGSLVVETGFPTSLIDLFVKNRSRFQKQRNPKKHQISDLQPPLLPAPPPSPSSLSPSLKVSPLRFVDETRTPEDFQSILPSNSAVIDEARDFEVHKDDSGVGDSGRVMNRVWEFKPNLVVATILNLLLVVVLILWVKKLNVGIILSAFVLLFFEFVGKRAASCLNLKPCWSTKKESRSLVSNVSCSFWFQAKKMKDCTVSEQESMVHGRVTNELCSDSSSIEAIEVVQATEIEIDISNSELKCIHRERKLGCQEIEEGEPKREVEDECKISEGRRKGKHRAELKSKMVKIFVPRKLRSIKKEKKGKNKSEALRSMEVVKSASFEIEDQEESMIQRSELVCIDEDKEEADHGTTCSNVESGRTDISAGNSECIVLILIALTGLVGGRTISVLFTMVGCFMIKMVKKTKWALVKT